ncbi:MAG: YlbE-like family protein [Bacillaceae bacterium]|nr:YlbE-like family protein [Bacillaceae bacterium]
MRQEVQMYLNQRQDLKQYLRINPVWYRKLSRNPQSISEMEQEAKIYYGKTFPQKVERFQSNLNMAMMLLEMIKGMGKS